MKLAKLLLLQFVFVSLCCNATELIVQKQISTSRALAGVVTVRGTAEPVNGATIDLCTPDWKTVILSTKTNDKGHFSLKQGRTAKLFYLRVSAPGMDTYQLRVRIHEHARQELSIGLSVAM